MVVNMLNNLLASLAFSYDIRVSPKYIMGYNMDDDEKKKQENISWQEYMEQYNYQYTDFFVDDEVSDTEPYYQNDIVFANPICKTCSKETMTLIVSIEQKSFLSKCPKCRITYKTKIDGE